MQNTARFFVRKTTAVGPHKSNQFSSCGINRVNRLVEAIVADGLCLEPRKQETHWFLADVALVHRTMVIPIYTIQHQTKPVVFLENEALQFEVSIRHVSHSRMRPGTLLILIIVSMCCCRVHMKTRSSLGLN